MQERVLQIWSLLHAELGRLGQHLLHRRCVRGRQVQRYRGAKGNWDCKADADCSEGKYCDAGADLNQNKCLDKKADNATCDLAGGGHQCKSGFCKLSRCYTPNSVAMGDICYNDDACKEGKCSSIDGTK